MKKIFCFIAPVLLLQACKEKGVVIDFGSKGKVWDTSYTAAVEKPQEKIILIEEFTGASCSNCPAGHDAVTSILDANPNRVVAVAYHTFNGGDVFEPVNSGGHKSKYDFRNTEATDISSNIYLGVGDIPMSGIDRVMVGTTRKFIRTEWAALVDSRKSVKTLVNLHLSSVYKATNNEVTVKVVLAYTSPMAKKNNLTIELIENGIVDVQTFPQHEEMEYEHMHILRKLLTPLYYGVPVKNEVAEKPAGFVYEYSYTFEPDAAWNLDNCRIVAFVSNNEGADQDVLQAAEVHVK